MLILSSILFFITFSTSILIELNEGDLPCNSPIKNRIVLASSSNTCNCAIFPFTTNPFCAKIESSSNSNRFEISFFTDENCNDFQFSEEFNDGECRYIELFQYSIRLVDGVSDSTFRDFLKGDEEVLKSVYVDGNEKCENSDNIISKIIELRDEGEEESVCYRYRMDDLTEYYYDVLVGGEGEREGGSSSKMIFVIVLAVTIPVVILVVLMVCVGGAIGVLLIRKRQKKGKEGKEGVDVEDGKKRKEEIGKYERMDDESFDTSLSEEMDMSKEKKSERVLRKKGGKRKGKKTKKGRKGKGKKTKKGRKDKGKKTKKGRKGIGMGKSKGKSVPSKAGKTNQSHNKRSKRDRGKGDSVEKPPRKPFIVKKKQLEFSDTEFKIVIDEVEDVIEKERKKKEKEKKVDIHSDYQDRLNKTYGEIKSKIGKELRNSLKREFDRSKDISKKYNLDLKKAKKNEIDEKSAEEFGESVKSWTQIKTRNRSKSAYFGREEFLENRLNDTWDGIKNVGERKRRSSFKGTFDSLKKRKGSKKGDGSNTLNKTWSGRPRSRSEYRPNSYFKKFWRSKTYSGFKGNYDWANYTGNRRFLGKDNYRVSGVRKRSWSQKIDQEKEKIEPSVNKERIRRKKKVAENVRMLRKGSGYGHKRFSMSMEDWLLFLHKFPSRFYLHARIFRNFEPVLNAIIKVIEENEKFKYFNDPDFDSNEKFFVRGEDVDKTCVIRHGGNCFDEMNFDDLLQGIDGTPWVVSFLVSFLKKDPKLIRELFIEPEKTQKYGFFIVKTVRGYIFIDNRMRCSIGKRYTNYYSTSRSNELYVEIIEKLFAKLYDGYSNLSERDPKRVGTSFSLLFRKKFDFFIHSTKPPTFEFLKESFKKKNKVWIASTKIKKKSIMSLSGADRFFSVVGVGKNESKVEMVHLMDPNHEFPTNVEVHVYEGKVFEMTFENYCEYFMFSMYFEL